MKKLLLLTLFLISCATRIDDIRIISQSELLSSVIDARLAKNEEKVSFINQLLDQGFEAVSQKNNKILPFSKVENTEDLICILYYGPQYISISNPSKKYLRKVIINKNLGVATISGKASIAPNSTIYILGTIEINKGYKPRDLCKEMQN